MFNKSATFLIHYSVSILIVICLSGGCASSRTSSLTAAQLIGTPVDRAQVAALEKQLLGQPAAAAENEFGPPLDVLRETDGQRQWYVFRTDRNTLGKFRYVMLIDQGHIQAVTKVQIGAATKSDYPRQFILRDRIMGKRPRECRKELKLGEPLLSVRSEKTHRSTELYDARLTKNRQIYFCLVRYNPSNYCEDLAFVSVDASTNPELSK